MSVSVSEEWFVPLRLAGRLGPPVWREGGERGEQREERREEEQRRQRRRDSEGEDQEMDEDSKVRIATYT